MALLAATQSNETALKLLKLDHDQPLHGHTASRRKLCTNEHTAGSFTTQPHYFLNVTTPGCELVVNAEGHKSRAREEVGFLRN